MNGVMALVVTPDSLQPVPPPVSAALTTKAAVEGAAAATAAGVVTGVQL